MIKQIQFYKSVFELKDLPNSHLQQLILCGRSNVGKSTFINSVSNRKTLAKTSSTPGKTRSINYYLVEKKFYLVDLPGFGYAQVSKKEREYWQKLIEEYFSSNRNIALVFHLIDSRHDPMNLDILLNGFLKRTGNPYFVLLTKTDKLKQSEIASAKKNVINFFPELSYNDNLFLYSAVKNTGKKEIAGILSRLLLSWKFVKTLLLLNKIFYHLCKSHNFAAG